MNGYLAWLGNREKMNYFSLLQDVTMAFWLNSLKDVLLKQNFYSDVQSNRKIWNSGKKFEIWILKRENLNP